MLVVGHVLWRGGELCVGLDDLVDRVQKVLFRGHLPSGPNGKHTGFRTHRPKIRQMKFGFNESCCRRCCLT